MSEALIREDRLRNLLLVEGHDDLHVCIHLLKSHHIKVLEKDKPEKGKTIDKRGIEIVPKEGIENLLEDLPGQLDGSDLNCLGILVDADDNLVSRWRSLYDILVGSGYSSIPTTPDPNGTIIKENDKLKVGIWIMPDNQLPGMLEHFCSFLVPTNDVLWVTAESSLQKVIQQDRRFIERHTIKAHLHTWLAWQEEPGKPIGQAITKRFLDPKAPHAQQFIKWIRLLFEIES
jgi:hypothetical protein